MRIPIPKNRLVAFTLAGALLTTIVAGGLAFPGLGFAASQDDGTTTSNAITSEQAAADAPTPNQNFTPAIQTQSSGGEYEQEEHDEEEEEYDEQEEERE